MCLRLWEAEKGTKVNFYFELQTIFYFNREFVLKKLRFLYATKFKFDKTELAMRTYTEWRKNSLPPKINDLVINFLVKI